MTELPQVYSQDYWDSVISQLKRRKLALAALVVLIALYAIAIFAPFLANDRPIYFEGVDLQSYRKAQREIVIAASSLADRVRDGEVSTRASTYEGADASSWSAILERESDAVRNRAAVLERQLAKEDAVPIVNLLETLEAVVVLGSESPGGTNGSGELENLETFAQKIRSEMSPVADPAEVRAGQTVLLVPYKAFPVMENLGRGEVFLMVLTILVLLFPFWNAFVDRKFLKNDRFRVRKARRNKMLLLILLPLITAVLWQGSSAEFFVSTYKSGLSSGNVIAKKVIFPLAPWGLAESNDGENFRPPTWHMESQINEDGYYEHGPRSGRFDEATGIPKAAQPVVVEFGEPSRNAIWRHPLGTDSLGRDMLARLVWGGRVSLAVGLVSTVLLVFIGTIVGAVAGYYGKWVDMVVSRIIEIVQTFPVFFLILIIVAFVGPSIMNIMIAIGIVRWTGVARLVRGEFIRLRDQDFVVASEALGVSSFRTIFRHVLPNAMGPVLVAATFSVASGILTESALSFLGFGIQLPIPSWGSLLIESRSAEHWWIQIYPGLLIFLTVMLYNLFGEGVRDALDPRLKVMQ